MSSSSGYYQRESSNNNLGSPSYSSAGVGNGAGAGTGKHVYSFSTPSSLSYGMDDEMDSILYGGGGGGTINNSSSSPMEVYSPGSRMAKLMEYSMNEGNSNPSFGLQQQQRQQQRQRDAQMLRSSLMLKDSSPTLSPMLRDKSISASIADFSAQMPDYQSRDDDGHHNPTTNNNNTSTYRRRQPQYGSQYRRQPSYRVSNEDNVSSSSVVSEGNLLYERDMKEFLGSEEEALGYSLKNLQMRSENVTAADFDGLDLGDSSSSDVANFTIGGEISVLGSGGGGGGHSRNQSPSAAVGSPRPSRQRSSSSTATPTLSPSIPGNNNNTNTTDGFTSHTAGSSSIGSGLSGNTIGYFEQKPQSSAPLQNRYKIAVSLRNESQSRGGSGGGGGSTYAADALNVTDNTTTTSVSGDGVSSQFADSRNWRYGTPPISYGRRSSSPTARSATVSPGRSAIPIQEPSSSPTPSLPVGKHSHGATSPSELNRSNGDFSDVLQADWSQNNGSDPLAANRSSAFRMPSSPYSRHFHDDTSSVGKRSEVVKKSQDVKVLNNNNNSTKTNSTQKQSGTIKNNTTSDETVSTTMTPTFSPFRQNSLHGDFLRRDDSFTSQSFSTSALLNSFRGMIPKMDAGMLTKRRLATATPPATKRGAQTNDPLKTNTTKTTTTTAASSTTKRTTAPLPAAPTYMGRTGGAGTPTDFHRYDTNSTFTATPKDSDSSANQHALKRTSKPPETFFIDNWEPSELEGETSTTNLLSSVGQLWSQAVRDQEKARGHPRRKVIAASVSAMDSFNDTTTSNDQPSSGGKAPNSGVSRQPSPSLSPPPQSLGNRKGNNTNSNSGTVAAVRTSISVGKKRKEVLKKLMAEYSYAQDDDDDMEDTFFNLTDLDANQPQIVTSVIPQTPIATTTPSKKSPTAEAGYTVSISVESPPRPPGLNAQHASPTAPYRKNSKSPTPTGTPGTATSSTQTLSPRLATFEEVLSGSTHSRESTSITRKYLEATVPSASGEFQGLVDLDCQKSSSTSTRRTNSDQRNANRSPSPNVAVFDLNNSKTSQHRRQAQSLPPSFRTAVTTATGTAATGSTSTPQSSRPPSQSETLAPSPSHDHLQHSSSGSKERRSTRSAPMPTSSTESSGQQQHESAHITSHGSMHSGGTSTMRVSVDGSVASRSTCTSSAKLTADKEEALKSHRVSFLTRHHTPPPQELRMSNKLARRRQLRNAVLPEDDVVNISPGRGRRTPVPGSSDSLAIDSSHFARTPKRSEFDEDSTDTSTTPSFSNAQNEVRVESLAAMPIVDWKPAHDSEGSRGQQHQVADSNAKASADAVSKKKALTPITPPRGNALAGKKFVAVPMSQRRLSDSNGNVPTPLPIVSPSGSSSSPSPVSLQNKKSMQPVSSSTSQGSSSEDEAKEDEHEEGEEGAAVPLDQSWKSTHSDPHDQGAVNSRDDFGNWSGSVASGLTSAVAGGSASRKGRALTPSSPHSSNLSSSHSPSPNLVATSSKQKNRTSRHNNNARAKSSESDSSNSVRSNSSDYLPWDAANDATRMSSVRAESETDETFQIPPSTKPQKAGSSGSTTGKADASSAHYSKNSPARRVGKKNAGNSSSGRRSPGITDATASSASSSRRSSHQRAASTSSAAASAAATAQNSASRSARSPGTRNLNTLSSNSNHSMGADVSTMSSGSAAYGIYNGVLYNDDYDMLDDSMYSDSNATTERNSLSGPILVLPAVKKDSTPGVAPLTAGKSDFPTEAPSTSQTPPTGTGSGSGSSTTTATKKANTPASINTTPSTTSLTGGTSRTTPKLLSKTATPSELIATAENSGAPSAEVQKVDKEPKSTPVKPGGAAAAKIAVQNEPKDSDGDDKKPEEEDEEEKVEKEAEVEQAEIENIDEDDEDDDDNLEEDEDIDDDDDEDEDEEGTETVIEGFRPPEFNKPHPSRDRCNVLFLLSMEDSISSSDEIWSPKRNCFLQYKLVDNSTIQHVVADDVALHPRVKLKTQKPSGHCVHNFPEIIPPERVRPSSSAASATGSDANTSAVRKNSNCSSVFAADELPEGVDTSVPPPVEKLGAMTSLLTEAKYPGDPDRKVHLLPNTFGRGRRAALDGEEDDGEEGEDDGNWDEDDEEEDYEDRGDDYMNYGDEDESGLADYYGYGLSNSSPGSIPTPSPPTSTTTLSPAASSKTPRGKDTPILISPPPPATHPKPLSSPLSSSATDTEKSSVPNSVTSAIKAPLTRPHAKPGFLTAPQPTRTPSPENKDGTHSLDKQETPASIPQGTPKSVKTAPASPTAEATTGTAAAAATNGTNSPNTATTTTEATAANIPSPPPTTTPSETHEHPESAKKKTARTHSPLRTTSTSTSTSTTIPTATPLKSTEIGSPKKSSSKRRNTSRSTSVTSQSSVSSSSSLSSSSPPHSLIPEELLLTYPSSPPAMQSHEGSIPTSSPSSPSPASPGGEKNSGSRHKSSSSSSSKKKGNSHSTTPSPS